MAGTFKKGKAKKRMASDILTSIATQDPNLIRRMWLALLQKACTGDSTAAALVTAYLDGKPHQSIDMDVEVTGDDTETASNDELSKALRDRLAGILPKRAVSRVEAGGSEGSGGEKKPH